MIEQAYIDLPQFNTYSNSVTPISHFYKTHKSIIPTETDINKLLPYAKQTDFILSTFHEIIDDLNYDKEKLKIMFLFSNNKTGFCLNSASAIDLL